MKCIKIKQKLNYTLLVILFLTPLLSKSQKSVSIGTNFAPSDAKLYVQHFDTITQNVNTSGRFEVSGSALRNDAVLGHSFGNAILSRGVVGFANGSQSSYGLYGSATGVGINYAVYGQALNGTTNWAGYFDGDVKISNRLGININSPQHPLHVLENFSTDDANVAGQFDVTGSSLKNDGITANSYGNAVLNRGLVGFANGNQLAYGLYGSANGTGTNYGVYGSGNGSGINYGVFGVAGSGSENWAGYFDGRLQIQFNGTNSNGALHIKEMQDDWARIKFENTTTTNFWNIAARPKPNNIDASFAIWYQGLGADVLKLLGNGNAILAGTLMQNSDARLKKDIRKLDTKIEDLKNIHGYHYYWKDENKDVKIQTGLLAQEVESIFPELVNRDENGILSLDYTGMIPHLLEIIKQQDERIKALEKRMNN